MKIVKIEYNKIPEKIKKSGYYSLTQDEKESLDSFEETELFLEDNDGDSSTIGILSEECILFIKKVFDKHNIKYNIKDITFSFIDFERLLNSFPDKKNQIEQYLFENFSVNDVLDKINLMGIECLNHIDKKILKEKI